MHRLLNLRSKTYQVITLFSFVLLTKNIQAESSEPACQAVFTACTNAGFVSGKYEEGYGLGVHCVRPLMQGIWDPNLIPGIKKALPSKSQTLLRNIQSCKNKFPEFGKGPVGYDKAAADKAAADKAAADKASSTVGNGLPDKPTNLLGRMAQGKAILTWTAPSNNGGRPIQKYLVRFRPKNQADWGTSFTANAQGRFTTPPLEDWFGKNYIFQVAAINSVGTGPYSENIELRTSPSAPQNLRVNVGPCSLGSSESRFAPVAKLQLSWTQPADLAGLSILDYLVSYEGQADGRELYTQNAWFTKTSADITIPCSEPAQTLKISVITESNSPFNTNSFSYTVASESLSWTQTIQFSPATGSPSAPRNFSVSRAESNDPSQPEIRLSWDPPSSTGGNPITGYIVLSSNQIGGGDHDRWLFGWEAINLDLEALKKGQFQLAYSPNSPNYKYKTDSCAWGKKYRVAAINATGLGAFSDPVKLKGSPCAPGIPQIRRLSQTSLGTVAVDATISTNGWGPVGSPMTDYDVQYTPVINGRETTWTSFPHVPGYRENITVSGLEKNTPYLFRLAWINSAGKSLYAAYSQNPVTITGLPEKPSQPSIVPGNLQAALSWTAPSDNGGESISKYLIRYTTNGGNAWSTPIEVPSSSLNYIFNGLTNGVTYSFQVAAQNKWGVGPFSDSSNPVISVSSGDMECPINVILNGLVSCAGNDRGFTPIQARLQCSGCGGNMYGEGTYWFNGNRGLVLPSDAHEIEVIGEESPDSGGLLRAVLNVSNRPIVNATLLVNMTPVDDRGRRTGSYTYFSPPARYKPFSKSIRLDAGNNNFSFLVNPIGCTWDGTQGTFFSASNGSYGIHITGSYRAAACNSNLFDPEHLEVPKRINFWLHR